MLIKNKRTGQQFEITESKFQETIVGNGAEGKYEILSDDKPVELKTLSVEVRKKTEKSKK